MNVTYSFGSGASALDDSLFYFVGLFSPPVPVPFTGKQSPYMQLPTGVPVEGNFTVPVQLINMRAGHSVALMSLNSTTNLYAALAVSNSVDFTNYRNPQHVHLVLQGIGRDSASRMGVQWTQKATNQPAMVRWGLSPTALTSVAVANSSTFTALEMCGNPGYHKGWRDSATQYQAVMTNLMPNKQVSRSVRWGIQEQYNFHPHAHDSLQRHCTCSLAHVQFCVIVFSVFLLAVFLSGGRLELGGWSGPVGRAVFLLRSGSESFHGHRVSLVWRYGTDTYTRDE